MLRTLLRIIPREDVKDRDILYILMKYDEVFILFYRNHGRLKLIMF